jgi:hypothetical protein
MMYQITRELDAALKRQGVPFPVVFGPEVTQSTGSTNERVVLEPFINDKRDTVGGPRASHPNPKMPRIRNQAARIRIFARSNLAGAAWHDHSERAEEVLDHLIVELDAIVRTRGNTLSFGAGGFVVLVDDKDSLVWSGAVYEQDVVVDRGCFRRTWKGESATEVVIGVDVEIENVVKVSNAPGAAGTPPVDAETASGG